MTKSTVQTAPPVAPTRIGLLDMLRIAMAEDGMINIRVSTKTKADAAFELEADSQPDHGLLMRQTKADIIAETNWS